MLVAYYEETGMEIKPGDTIFDFHGDEAIFVCASRRRIESKSGKVIVRWKALHGVKNQPGSYYYDDGRKTQYEYYDRVFNLEVREIHGRESAENF